MNARAKKLSKLNFLTFKKRASAAEVQRFTRIGYSIKTLFSLFSPSYEHENKLNKITLKLSKILNFKIVCLKVFL